MPRQDFVALKRAPGTLKTILKTCSKINAIFCLFIKPLGARLPRWYATEFKAPCRPRIKNGVGHIASCPTPFDELLNYYRDRFRNVASYFAPSSPEPSDPS